MAMVIKHSSISILSSALLCFLFMFSCVTFWYQSTIVTDENIVNDVLFLSSIFKNIDEQCGILDFKFQSNNSIDYLQVISFEGSEIGSMALKYPHKWNGPYLRDNLTAQGKFYQIIKTYNGYFILPGDGVVLHNGKIMGKDIKHDYSTNIAAMLKNPTQLQFQGKSLGTKLSVRNV